MCIGIMGTTRDRALISLNRLNPLASIVMDHAPIVPGVGKVRPKR